MAVRRYMEGDTLVLEDDGEELDPADYWCDIAIFPSALHAAIQRTSNCSWNGTVLFPPDRPWAAASYEQMFYYAIADVENADTRSPVHLLTVFEFMRRCRCLAADVRENLLHNIRLKL